MSNSNIDRARAWLRNTPGAISGQGGHNTTFAVATALVHGFELSHGEAETLLHEYNAKCLPPWKPNDLVHKLNEAFRVSHDKPKGWLLSAQSGTPVSTTGKFIVQKIQAIPQPECRFTTIDFADLPEGVNTVDVLNVILYWGNSRIPLYYLPWTDFTLIGAASNTVGVQFVATGVGSGSGTAKSILILGGGANPGVISGTYSRSGATTTVAIEFYMGELTNLGTGGIRISLPHAMKNDILFAGGTVYMNIGGTIYEGFVQIPGAGADYIELLRDTSGSVTYNSPALFTWTSASIKSFIRLSLTYPN